MPETQIIKGANILRLKRLSINFSKYSIVGVVFTVIYIFLMWLFVDILKVNTLISSCIVVVGIHIVKYIAYKQVKLIHKQFNKYTYVQVGSGVLNVVGFWFLVDGLHLSTVFSSLSITSVLFVLRFILFKITRLTIE